MPAKRKGSLSPGESMQRSEEPSTAVETLLPAGILTPLTQGSPLLQCPGDPQTRIFHSPTPFFGNPYQITGNGIIKHL